MRKLFASVFAVILAGCAAPVTSLTGQNLTKGAVIPSSTVPAVRVGAKANLLHQGKRLKFDVWIEADSTKGRLDALGPFGTPLATVIWEDSAWKAWLPGQSTLLRGYGNAVNLPVLGLKDIHPSLLVAPLLGRVFPKSGAVRVASPNNAQSLVIPANPPTSWSLLIDKSTGLPVRRQNLQDGREVEGLTFHRWRKQGEVLVPGIIDRTTPDGQLLQLELGEWSAMSSVPSEHLKLSFQTPVDTITLARNDRGQTVYRIRAATEGGDSTSVVLSGPHLMTDAPVDDGALIDDDTLSQDDESDESDSSLVEEETELKPSADVAGPKTTTPKDSKGLAPTEPKAIIPPKHGRKR